MPTATPTEVELHRFKELLRYALAELDTISAEPDGYVSEAGMAAQYRQLAGGGAKYIRDKLRVSGYRT